MMHPYLPDYRGVGVSNLSQMVNDNLGTQGYQVVRTIYDNLVWLHQIYDVLPNALAVSQQAPVLERVSAFIDSIYEVHKYLNEIINLNGNIPLVQELAPRIESFVNELSMVRTQIESNSNSVKEITETIVGLQSKFYNTFTDYTKKVEVLTQQTIKTLNQETQKALCALDKERVYVENLYTQIKQFVPMYEKVASQQDKINVNLAHINATDAVTMAMFTNQENHKAEALNIIKYSEKVGNDESINRARLGYKPKDLNMFKILTDNYVRLGSISSGVTLKEPEVKITSDCGCKSGGNND